MRKLLLLPPRFLGQINWLLQHEQMLRRTLTLRVDRSPERLDYVFGEGCPDIEHDRSGPPMYSSRTICACSAERPLCGTKRTETIRCQF